MDVGCLGLSSVKLQLRGETKPSRGFRRYWTGLSLPEPTIAMSPDSTSPFSPYAASAHLSTTIRYASSIRCCKFHTPLALPAAQSRRALLHAPCIEKNKSCIVRDQAQLACQERLIRCISLRSSRELSDSRRVGTGGILSGRTGRECEVKPTARTGLFRFALIHQTPWIHLEPRQRHGEVSGRTLKRWKSKNHLAPRGGDG